MDYHKEIVLILDFGSQYTQLIARKVRELGVYCEIYPYHIDLHKVMSLNPKGIILSGGPRSVTESDAPICDEGIFSLNIPVLGICYGLQLITRLFKGKVDKSVKREYGKAHIFLDEADRLLEGVRDGDVVWMSHQDKILKMPKGFKTLAHSDNSPYAAIKVVDGKIYGVQFHPEVHHTPKGKRILKNFLYKICRVKGLFSPKSFVELAIDNIRKEVGKGNVICALSGGVDS
ncbi:MAG: glutamine-hydrolyzing GMP synthase, partial [Proteobacteria bacterium]|nr:glutamine-hydrolyzing GMP synthase [Pseudomonadota bacterium]